MRCCEMRFSRFALTFLQAPEWVKTITVKCTWKFFFFIFSLHRRSNYRVTMFIATTDCRAASRVDMTRRKTILCLILIIVEKIKIKLSAALLISVDAFWFSVLIHFLSSSLSLSRTTFSLANHFFSSLCSLNKSKQTIENEFHVAMTAEKSASTRPSTSKAKAQPTTTQGDTAPKTESVCLESEMPLKPPRQRPRSSNQALETTIDNLDDGIDVSCPLSSVMWWWCDQLTLVFLPTHTRTEATENCIT